MKHITLERRLGLFDITMVVIGGIIGAGIFVNPHVVAREVPSVPGILAAWLLGGGIALAGAAVYAELAGLRPNAGGQYAFFKEALHPLVGFLYGWGLLTVTQTGGMAAVAITFARHFLEVTGWKISDQWVAAGALGLLTVVNCFGVRAGAWVQNLLTLLKMAAIALLVGCGFLLVRGGTAVDLPPTSVAPTAQGWGLLSFGAAMVPVLFAYGGAQTACFLGGEVRDPRRNLALGLLLGVGAVVVLYLSVSGVCLKALGVAGLAGSRTPALDVMRLALGDKGVAWIAAGIAFSTLGFLSQGMLTAPRVYYAMADDGLFLKAVAWLHPKSRVPVVAIMLQGLLAIGIACWGQYEQILNYVISVDAIFYGLVGVCLFLLRKRPAEVEADADGPPSVRLRVPFHPWTTLFFIASYWLTVVSLILKHPADSVKGLLMLATGIPVYAFWKAKARRAARRA